MDRQNLTQIQNHQVCQYVNVVIPNLSQTLTIQL